MRRLLLIEPALTGHRFLFVRWIADAALTRGYRIVIATDPTYRSHPTLQTLSDCNGVEVRFHDFACPAGEGIANMVRREFAYRSHFKAVARTTRQEGPLDLVVIPYADYCLYAMALSPSPFMDIPWAGVSMRPSFHCHAFGMTDEPPSLIARIKQQLFLRLATSGQLAALAVFDPYLAQFVATRRAKSRVHYLQQPIDTAPPIVPRHHARSRLGLPVAKPIVLLYGSIDARKGVQELLAAQSSLPAAQRPHVVIAGRLHLKLEATNDLTIIDRFVSDEEEALLFGACNAVWVGYRGHLGSSAVLWQALAFERPVIACKDGLIGQIARTETLGITVDTGNPAEVAAALRNLPFFAPRGTLEPASGRDFVAKLFKQAGL
jgi:glycosyltransferase involved in cell wall biosynthesis